LKNGKNFGCRIFDAGYWQIKIQKHEIAGKGEILDSRWI